MNVFSGSQIPIRVKGAPSKYIECRQFEKTFESAFSCYEFKAINWIMLSLLLRKRIPPDKSPYNFTKVT